MPDAVALTSVTSSGLVAVGGLWLTYRTGKEQRAHEERLAYEGRAWDRKVEGLFGLIATAQEVKDAASGESRVASERILRRIVDFDQALREFVPVIEAYGSDQTRRSLSELRALAERMRPDAMSATRLDELTIMKAEAIDAGQFESAASLRMQERLFVSDLLQKAGLDPSEFVRAATSVIEAARASVRGEA